MQFRFELEGGNFSKAGYASSQIKKVLKQLSVDPRIIKRVVVALYEAEVNVVAHAWRGTVLADIEADRISLLLQDEGARHSRYRTGHAGRFLHRIGSRPRDGVRCRHGVAQYEEECR